VPRRRTLPGGAGRPPARQSRTAAVLAWNLTGTTSRSNARQCFDSLQGLPEEWCQPFRTHPGSNGFFGKRGRAWILRVGQVHAHRQCIVRIESGTFLLEQEEASKHESCPDQKYERKCRLGDDQQAPQTPVLGPGSVPLAGRQRIIKVRPR